MSIATPDSLNSPLAILMHRLLVASYKLDVIVKAHPDPAQCDPDELGAIVIVREVASEIDALYCRFTDQLSEAGLLKDGPLVDRFPPYPPDDVMLRPEAPQS